MISLLKMPKLSPTMEIGTLVKWHKQSGDPVAFGDVLMEISTDKAVLEHTASEDGWILQIILPEGKKAKVGEPLAVFSTEQNAEFDLEALLTPKKSIQEEPPVQEPTEGPQSTQEAVVIMGFKPEPPLSSPLSLKNPLKQCPISPLAKKLARERNLDVSGIQGSGPGGRIVQKDLERAPAKRIAGFGYPEAPDQNPGSYIEESMSSVREVIARRLQAAKVSIPHFYVKQRVYATPLLKLLKELKAQDIKLSINDCIVRACSLALKECPELNSGFNSINQTIVRFQTIDISIAVALPDGIITPIVRCADRKNVGTIAAEIKSLVNKARSRSLKEEEYKGGSFCVSNLGMTGITEFSAIINPPQAAILAVGSVEEQPIVINGEIVVGATCMLTLSADHRVVDGYPAAMFLKRLQKILESPAVLLLN